MTDERKDRENETKPAPQGDEQVSDLTSKKLNRDEEGKVKGGGGFRPQVADDLT
ncbi:MAG TPA: hypothetical protein VMM77_11095 [Gemmatimonadaceae bacterium]|nr:hypothetical protein [Gemmatimonadaceae bacterium]